MSIILFTDLSETQIVFAILQIGMQLNEAHLDFIIKNLTDENVKLISEALANQILAKTGVSSLGCSHCLLVYTAWQTLNLWLSPIERYRESNSSSTGYIFEKR